MLCCRCTDLLLRVTQDDDDGVIWVDADPIMRTAPLGVLNGAVVGVVTGCPVTGWCRLLVNGERRALLEQRRAAVVRQLRRLAIELTDIDRQLDEIEQSER